ncbi:MAG: hypothetical protein ACU841_12005 [Gammaproteobacteria bacterium]
MGETLFRNDLTPRRDVLQVSFASFENPPDATAIGDLKFSLRDRSVSKIFSEQPAYFLIGSCPVHGLEDGMDIGRTSSRPQSLNRSMASRLSALAVTAGLGKGCELIWQTSRHLREPFQYVAPDRRQAIVWHKTARSDKIINYGPVVVKYPVILKVLGVVYANTPGSAYIR